MDYIVLSYYHIAYIEIVLVIQLTEIIVNYHSNSNSNSNNNDNTNNNDNNNRT